MADRYTASRGVRRLGPGRWEVRARVTDPKTGRSKETRRVVQADSVEAAIAARVALEQELTAAPTCSTSRLRLADYATLWLARRAPRLRASTQERYVSSLAHAIEALGPYYLDSLTPADVDLWLSRMAREHSPATVNGWLRVLRSCLRDAVAELGIPDPTARVRALPEGQGTRQALTAPELAALLEHVQEHDSGHYPLLLTLSLTGLRWGEATALRWEDLDREHGVILVRRAHWRGRVGPTKSGKSRVVPMPQVLWEALQSRRVALLREQDTGLAEGWVFAVQGRQGVALAAPSSWAKCLPKWLHACGISRTITPHSFRRTFVDLLRQAGVDQVTRRAIVGHAGEAVHERYSTVGAGEAQQAAEAVLRVIGGEK